MSIVMRPCLLLVAALAACASTTDDEHPELTALTTNPLTESGVHAEYFDGYHDLRVERIEPRIEHDWRSEAPATGIAQDRFSARWTATLTPTHSGRTTFIVDADDGVRLWINDKLIVDDWRGHFVERHTGTFDLVANQPVSFRLEYFELDLAASLKVSWSATGLSEQVIPTERLTANPGPTGLPGPKPPFRNPVVPFDCPDPGVLMDGSLFYAVCTGGSFPIRTSRDLVRWESTSGAILPQGKPAWAANGHRNWAPELHRGTNGRYLAYYTTVNAQNVLSIGVATASSLLGPWTDKGAPLVEDPKGVIDATFFADEDGKQWLFYKIDGNAHGQPTPMFVRPLAADGLSFTGGPTQVLTNNLGWEGGVVEAPWVVKRNGRYYMFYSGNVYDHRYRTGVARASSLTGPWEKLANPVLANNSAWVGPGHGSVVTTNGSDYFVYHAWTNAGNGTAGPGGRKILVDKIVWGANGWPTISNGSPSLGDQIWPAALP